MEVFLDVLYCGILAFLVYRVVTKYRKIKELRDDLEHQRQELGMQWQELELQQQKLTQQDR